MAKIIGARKTIPDTKSTVVTVPRNAGTTPLSTKIDQKKKYYPVKKIGRF